MPVSGIDRVLKGFKMTVDRAAGPVSEGAVYAILSQGGALAQTMTPIDTSTLINSQYAPQVDVQRGKVAGTLGYTASYAFAVHNASGKLAGQPRENGNGDYWDPSGEPGFLSKGFDQVQAYVPGILRHYYKV